MGLIFLVDFDLAGETRLRNLQADCVRAPSLKLWRVGDRSPLWRAKAERVGFEPTVVFLPQRFSRPSHSSTLAPLRVGGAGLEPATSSV